MNEREVGIYVGRFCPLHNGHVTTMCKILDNHGIDNSMFIIGSVGTISDRVPYTYAQRRIMIKNIFGNGIVIAGIADLPGNDVEWLRMLVDMIRIKFEGRKIVFYGGNEDDLYIFKHCGYATRIVHRSNITGTEIRKRLKNNEDVSNLMAEFNIPVARSIS